MFGVFSQVETESGPSRYNTAIWTIVILDDGTGYQEKYAGTCEPADTPSFTWEREGEDSIRLSPMPGAVVGRRIEGRLARTGRCSESGLREFDYVALANGSETEGSSHVFYESNPCPYFAPVPECEPNTECDDVLCGIEWCDAPPEPCVR